MTDQEILERLALINVKQFGKKFDISENTMANVRNRKHAPLARTRQKIVEGLKWIGTCESSS